jgi:hypothetical protein
VTKILSLLITELKRVGLFAQTNTEEQNVKPMKYAPVLIVWKDITTKHGWINQDELDEFVMDNKENIVQQTGFLYEEDESQVVMVDSFFEALDLFGNVTKIPKENIIELTKLTKL